MGIASHQSCAEQASPAEQLLLQRSDAAIERSLYVRERARHSRSLAQKVLERTVSPADASRRVRERLHQLEVVEEATQQFSHCSKTATILEEASRQTARVVWSPGTPARRVQIDLLDQDKVTIAAETDDLGFTFLNRSLPLSMRPVLQDALRRDQIAVGETLSDPARLQSTMACAPIHRRGEVCGAISAFDRVSSGFSEDQLRRLVVMAALTDRTLVSLERSETTQHEARRLTEMETVKSEFLKVASHELRGPLGVLRGYIAMLQEGSFDELPAERAQAYRVLEGRLGQMTVLVDQMLEAARLEDGQIKLLSKRLDLRKPIHQAWEEARRLALKTHELQLETPGEPVPVEGDEIRLLAIAQNLLDNAIKYSPTGGRVRCRIDLAPNMAVTEVSDEGIGIAREEMPRLFTRFGRIVTLENGAIPGVGLGLYLCRELAHMHGGELTASSEAGRGSTFRLRLPLARGTRHCA